MRDRLMWSAFCCGALLIGVFDYALYRPDTYIGTLFMLPAIPFHQGYPFFAYYFPDFLWAFSLNFGLFAIVSPLRKNTWLCTIIAAVYGGLWELFQHFTWVSGTADFVDISMYITACFFAVIIKHSILRRKQK